SVVGYEPREIQRRGGTYTMLVSGGQQRAGILEKPVDEWQPVWLTYFGVTDPAAAARRAEALGGTVIAAPSPGLREGTMAVVTDPSGAILVLQQIS
ncbi:MAG: VOC family protein, partial [Gemmatimonadota bacterium]